jgi:DNA modification methylase
MKLNLGTTGHEPGWTTVDILPGADITMDLVRDEWTFEAAEEIKTVHFLQELPLRDAINVLNKCYQILIPRGKLTVNVPDIDKAIHAYVMRDETFFLNKGKNLDQKFLWHLMWGGSNLSFYNIPFISQLLEEAGFTMVRSVMQTSKPNESLEVEARK